ncbi:zinc-binding dehydrogenase [Agromyces aerolatus]|uniref:zinc-binding dehydrogenase n=1 Tax=Agromyces sp. LY-1074 TaxID=3074080 RepID=UPI0028657DF7|nr:MULTISPECIES: zinc-binding dehydrogenase [unclassified Agromyces]MDR5699753.1 zinc-binding dehydrogenase [Agromyces sp. LY-1074]MDR5706049.1 zinc-binding dehydrogenase [Agromyces sp. LY-1358]
MRRAVATSIALESPESVIAVQEVDDPAPKDGWVEVEVRATSLNQHDLWAIKGVGVEPDAFPLGLGSDVAGVTADGREVIVHSLVTDPDRAAAAGGELLAPGRVMLAEASGGGAAERVLVPARNLVDKPANTTFAEAAGLPTAWLTAYHMLFRKACLAPGSTVLVQGAGGGVATAAIALAAHSGMRVWVTGRDASRLEAASGLGAERVFPSGTRLPERVDAVIETVGAATWSHSMRSVRPGGVIVVAGATTGGEVTFDLNRVFLQHVSILGSSLGTVDDLRALASWVRTTGVKPVVDSIHPLDDAATAVARLASGDAIGKVVISV